MRELTKSMVSFSWAISLFGVKQMTNLLTPQSFGQAAASFNEVTRAAEQQLGGPFRSLYQAGDGLQRAVVNTMLGVLGIDGPWNPVGAMQAGVDVVRQSAQAGMDLMQRSAQVVGQAVPGAAAWGNPAQAPPSGWGPVGTPGS